MLDLIKQVAMEAVEAGKPADFSIGTVKSTSPLQIGIDQKLILGEGCLLVSERLTDYEKRVRLTPDGGEPYHYTALYYHGLHAGEMVLLLRMAGGQMYAVLDRLGKGGSGQ